MESLRERKKRKTKAALQAHALRLFSRQGYAATTVEQIAAAAEVSPSTFFRYFPTKESVVMFDSLDAQVADAFYNQSAHLNVAQALKGAVSAVFAEATEERLEVEDQRIQLVRTEPSLRAYMIDEMVHGVGLLANMIAKRTGRQPSEPAVHNLAAAIAGIMISVFFTSSSPSDRPFIAFEEALSSIESGIEML